MNQLVIHLKNVTKSYREKDILAIDDLKVYANEKIGIVGRNGEGKTTLLQLIIGEVLPDSGAVDLKIDLRFYTQIDTAFTLDYTAIDTELLSRLNVPEHDSKHYSGGEQTRARLAEFFSDYHFGLLMDEPTTHLDRDGIQFLVEQLKYYYGTLIVVSHDRYFLDEVVDTIWEVRDSGIHVYKGNYSAYQEQREHERIEQDRAYEAYTKEKKRLELAAQEKQSEAAKMSQVSAKQRSRAVNPGRLGSSKQKDSVQKAAHRSAKAIEKRAEMLETAERAVEDKPVHFPLPKVLEMHNPYPIIGRDVTIRRGDKLLFDNVSFEVQAGEKIAILGRNGSGKSTLLRHITEGGEGITLAKKAVFSIYQQTDYRLVEDLPVIDYLMQGSEYSESIVRSVLNQLGFDQRAVTRQSVQDLSGGEATRLVIAKLFTDPSNVLILDEPTNFIDVQTIEALEVLMKSYPCTILFTSHDRYFIEHTAQKVWLIEDKKLKLE